MATSNLCCKLWFESCKELSKFFSSSVTLSTQNWQCHIPFVSSESGLSIWCSLCELIWPSKRPPIVLSCMISTCSETQPSFFWFWALLSFAVMLLMLFSMNLFTSLEVQQRHALGPLDAEIIEEYFFALSKWMNNYPRNDVTLAVDLLSSIWANRDSLWLLWHRQMRRPWRFAWSQYQTTTIRLLNQLQTINPVIFWCNNFLHYDEPLSASLSTRQCVGVCSCGMLMGYLHSSWRGGLACKITDTYLLVCAESLLHLEGRQQVFLVGRTPV